MELKAIIAIFRKQKKYFWMTVFTCIFVGALLQYFQKESVASNLTLNITRLGKDTTSDYQYHDFYRLQADERFADTVVRWLGSPRMIADIYEDVRLIASDDNNQSSLPHAFKAERLSSQMIQVTYSADNAMASQKIAQSLIFRVNARATALNKDQQETTWFVVVGGDPVVSDGRVGIALMLAIALALGIFLGFWAVLFRHYFSK